MADSYSTRRMMKSNLDLNKYSHIFLEQDQNREKLLAPLFEKTKNTDVKFFCYKFLFTSLRNGSLSSEHDFQIKSNDDEEKNCLQSGETLEDEKNPLLRRLEELEKEETRRIEAKMKEKKTLLDRTRSQPEELDGDRY